jgi:hypothetical protein
MERRGHPVKLLLWGTSVVLGLLLMTTVIASSIETEPAMATCAIWTSALDRDDGTEISDAFTASAHQEEMARLVLGATHAQHQPRRAAEVALALALTRSGLRNLPGGDANGEGIYGLTAITAADVDRHDPTAATTALVAEITDTEDWQTKPASAFATLVDAEPDLIDGWEVTAAALADRWWLSGQNPTTCSAPATDGTGSPVGADQITTVEGIRVHHSIASQVAALLAAARADGINLSGWGWRDSTTQIRLRSEHCAGPDGVASNHDIYDKPGHGSER